MKNIIFKLFIIALSTATLFSCSSSNKVATNSFIQKRKYNKGVHWAIKKDTKHQITTSNEPCETELHAQATENTTKDIPQDDIQEIPSNIEKQTEKTPVKESSKQKLLVSKNNIKEIKHIIKEEITNTRNNTASKAKPAFNGDDILGIVSFATGIGSLIFGTFGLIPFFIMYGIMALFLALAAIITGSIGKKADELGWMLKMGKTFGFIGIALAIIDIAIFILVLSQ